LQTGGNSAREVRFEIGALAYWGFATVLRAIIGFCLKERLIVLLLCAATIGYGWYCVEHVPLDAIPNVGEQQVIIFSEWAGRSPKDVENQVTYPLSVALLTTPGAQSVRGRSMLGYSFVQVTFSDDVDFYWARSRVAERLSTAQGMLPAGVNPAIGPDATALGQIFWYHLEPPVGMNLADLRSIQDYVVKYALQSVDGVSEVASVGGYIRQYQIEIDPDKLRFHDVPLERIVEAIKQSNIDVGAKTVQVGGMEFLIRGIGYVGAGAGPDKAVTDIEETVVESRQGVPLRIKNLGMVQLGPEFRQGAIDVGGAEAVGGVVVMRFRENPRKVIARVREKIEQLEPALNGVKFHIVYDRTNLIDETVNTLTEAIFQETIITVVVIVVFLLHVRASIVIAATLPIAVLMAYIGMRWWNIDANIMSLAGIAIAIGEVVDMGIILSENIYQRLAEWEAKGSPGGEEERKRVIHEAACEVAPAVVTAVGTTIVAFFPIFFLTGRDYKLFAPLAWTKSFAMVASLIVAVVMIPPLTRTFLRSTRWRKRSSVAAGSVFGALVAGLAYFVWYHRLTEWADWAVESLETVQPGWASHLAPFARLFVPIVVLVCGAAGFAFAYFLTQEKLRPVEENPSSRLIRKLYEPTLRFLLRHKLAFVVMPVAVALLGLGAWFGLQKVLNPLEAFASKLGTELNDVPGYVEFKHKFVGLKTDDWIALDEGTWFYMPTLYPAASLNQSLEVLQTQDLLIKQIPEVEDVLGKIGRVESPLDPAPAEMVETVVTLKPRDQWRPGMTERKIWDEINAVATLPGVTPASPLQPIEGRVVMLQSGIKAPMGIRIYGDSLEGLAKASFSVARLLKTVHQVDAKTVNPDIVLGKPYLEFEVDRASAARFGMTTAMVNQVIETALGGVNLTTTVEGRERYPIRIRYQRHLRERIEELKRLPVVAGTGEVVPLELLASMKTTWGPAMITSENARLVAYVLFAPSGLVGDLETVDAVVAAIHRAREDGSVDLPAGYDFEPVGSFQNQIEANRRLRWIVPLVGLTSLVIIYLQFRQVSTTLIVFSSIPVAFAGGMIFLGLAEIEMNTAIWVGFIALFGIAEDDSVVMATYLEQIFSTRRMRSVQAIRDAVVEAGLRRIRPCLMTTFDTLAALIPVMISTGRGADVARAMALPVFGGMFVQLITLFIVPVVYCWIKEMRWHTGLLDESIENGTPPAAPLDAESRA
jgi:Cu(I)/Ag(I) efflux system membrane protein CusA/SilA